MNTVYRYLYNKYRPQGPGWLPLAAVYYLTYNCPLRCTYCSDGSGKPYYALPQQSPPLAEAAEILAAIRRSCDVLILTGGEPAFHPEFRAVLGLVERLKFSEVILTTKGDRLAGLEAELNSCVTRLVLSIDTLDPAKARGLCRTEEPVLERTMRNAQTLAALPGRRFELYISSVAGPFNLDDLRGVFDYSQQIGAWYAAQPQLAGVKAPAELMQDARYRSFYDHLIARKRAGARVFGPQRYLELLRDFEKFDCYPFTMLVVSPAGEVFYPCLEAGRVIGKIQDARDAGALRAKGLNELGSKPLCDNRCHSACAAEYSVFMRYPLAALAELFAARRSAAG